MTLQVMLHSLRIFTGHVSVVRLDEATLMFTQPSQNEVQPPALLALAISHIPPPFPSLITNGLRYLRMGGAFLDDLSAVVFGMGMVIVIASWFAS